MQKGFILELDMVVQIMMMLTDYIIAGIVDTGKVEKNSNGMKLYAGYQFNNIIAIEIGYTKFGFS